MLTMQPSTMNQSMTNDGLAPGIIRMPSWNCSRNGSVHVSYPNIRLAKTLFEELRTGNAAYPDRYRW